MIVLQPDFIDAYKTIQNLASSPVLLLVTAECDSVCAARILMRLFKMDNVPYKTKIVSNYSELKQSVMEASEQFEEDDNGRQHVLNVVMLNCGGSVGLQAFLDPPEHLSIYVIDSHRPYNLSNVDQHNLQVKVIDDHEDPFEYPSEDDSSSSDESDQENNPPYKRSRQKTPLEVAEREGKRQLIAEYYSGSFYGTNASTLCYSLSQQLSRNDPDMLWNAIVGLTDQYLHEKIDSMRYDRAVLELRQDIREREEGDLVTAEGVIEFDPQEFCFLLYRHWNLWESISHCKYFVSRMGLWKSSGLSALRTLLARMGVPLKECSFGFSVMKSRAKMKFKGKLEEFSSDYNLENRKITFASFQRRFTGDLIVSASDVVLAVCAFLENEDYHGLEAIPEKSFWKSYKCLSRENHKILRSGIHLAIETQKRLVEAASSVLVQKKVNSAGVFRYALLDSLDTEDCFTKPLTLLKLAQFVRDAYHMRRQPKPFVMGCLNHIAGTYLLVGLGTSGRQRDVTRNLFGTLFAHAAHESHAKVRHDGFEECIIEIQKDDIQNFINVLMITMEPSI